ncbi:hypothetical protein [Mesorhizobium sp. M0185]|uniref:hypothetical protein n=1 Tax=Mesorhizobium sp. M0185 TaxID=2956907 RepID=UPI003337FC55
MAYGTHITVAPNAYDGHNNNRWISPNYEMGGSVGVNRVPIFFDGAGGLNTWHDARAEACFGPLVICKGSSVLFNEIGFSFASTAVAGQLNTIQETNGANSNRLTGRYGVEVRASLNNLHRLLSSNGGANSPYLRGDLFLMAQAGGTALRTTTLSNVLRSNALALDLNAASVMVAVDTTKIKQWRVNIGYVGALTGSLLAIAFDSSGTLLTGNSLDIDGTAWAISTAYSTLNQVVTNDTGKLYQLVTAGTSAGAGGPTGRGSAIADGTCVWNYAGTEKYIKNSSAAWVATTTYGGGYLGSAFVGGMVSVRPDVATMWIGIASGAPRSIEIIGYSTQETIGNINGLTSIIPSFRWTMMVRSGWRLQSLTPPALTANIQSAMSPLPIHSAILTRPMPIMTGSMRFLRRRHSSRNTSE